MWPVIPYLYVSLDQVVMLVSSTKYDVALCVVVPTSCMNHMPSPPLGDPSYTSPSGYATLQLTHCLVLQFIGIFLHQHLLVTKFEVLVYKEMKSVVTIGTSLCNVRQPVKSVLKH